MAFKVGVVRDTRYLDHKPGLIHPESPSRLRSVYRMLDKEFGNRVVHLDPQLATLEHLEMVHTPSYVKLIMSTAERDFTTLASDTFVSSKSYLAAWLAVGGCIRGIDALFSESVRSCFCLGRPPGHHALTHRAGGFCIFNNIGVAAKYAIAKYGVERVLIVDWDVHHGNAIQDLFYSDDRVLYFSSHYMGWYPNTGDWEETGELKGKGYNVNVPVPKDMVDADIIHIYRDALSQIVKKYKPQLFLVAAGFDAHKDDPLGRTRLTEKAYYWLTQLILQLSDSVNSAPILFSLEGGYDNYALAISIKEVLSNLAFEGRRERIPSFKSEKAQEVLDKLRSVHSKHRIWTA
ncbi:MAG: histone deacetylase [Desulfomonilaceae bacterium]